MDWFEKLYTKDYIQLCGFGSPEQTAIEAAFLVDVLRLSSDSRLLDICCGFGRHTFAISNLAHCQIVGIDLSDEYLTIAKEQYSSPNITYLKKDMRDLQLERRFDAATNVFTSFGFFEHDEENEQVMQEANKALKQGGLFLVDIENKFNFVLNDVLKKEYYWEQIDEHTYCVIHNTYDVVHEREIFSATIVEDGKDAIRVGYNIRLYSLPELTSMLERNGFELLNVWGDFDKRNYSLHSRRLITLAQKTRDL